MDKIKIIIDGEPIEYTDVYPIDECIFNIGIGGVMGMNEHTGPSAVARYFSPFGKGLYVINVFNRNADGSIWGIKGAFRSGTWSNSDGLCLSVEERVI